MAKKYLIAILFAFAFLSFAEAQTPPAEAGNDAEDGQGMEVKSVDGLRLAVPKDMPITKKGSLVVPMSMEEYVAMKFSEIESRLKKIEESIAKNNQDLASIKEVLQPMRGSSSFLKSAETNGLFPSAEHKE